MFNKLTSLFRKEEKIIVKTSGSYDEFGTWIGSSGVPWEPVAIEHGRIWKREELIRQRYWVRDFRELDRGIIYDIHHLPWNLDISVFSPGLSTIEGENLKRYEKACQDWIDLGLFPCIVSAMYVEEIDGIPRLFIQSPPARNLKDWILEKELHTLAQAVEIAIQVCSALDYMHGRNIVYRTLRPENIFITDEETRIKILFNSVPRVVGKVSPQDTSTAGLKKIGINDIDGDLQPGPFVGFPLYMAPEQWKTPYGGSIETDIYSFGCLLFELICDVPPFLWKQNDKRPPLLAYMVMHLNQSPPDPQSLKSQIPKPLADITLACLQKDPAKRPRTAREIVHVLRKVFRELGDREAIHYSIPEEKLKPDNLNNRALVLLSDRGGQAEKAARSQELFEELLREFPQHPQALINHELLLLERGVNTKETTILRLQDMTTAPVNKSHLMKAAMWAMVQGGEPSFVKTVVDRAESREKDLAWLYNMKGILLQKLESPSQSLTAFEKAVALEPTRWEYAYNLGVVWYRQSKHDEAEKYLEIAAGLSTDPRITVAHALVFSSKGQLKDAEEILLDSLTRHPDSIWLNYHLGALYGSMGLRVPGFDSFETDLEKSFPYMEKAIRKGPGVKRTREAYTECARRRKVTVDLPNIIFRDPPNKEERELGALWKVRNFRVFRGHREQVTSVSIAWNGRVAVSGGTDDVVNLWDPLTGNLVGTFRGHEDWVRSVSLPADGMVALSGSKDSTLRLWQIPGGQCLQVCRGHESEVYAVRLSYDGNMAVSGGEDRTVRYWNLRSGECLVTMKGHRSRVSTLAISADGRYALSGSLDRTIRFWEISSGRCLKTLKGHEGEVLAISMTADARFAVSGGSDNTVRLWDIENAVCLRTMPGHAKEVTSVDISPDLRFALSGSWDETVRLWDLGLGECIGVMGGHQGPVLGVALFADGRFGLSASRDKTVRMWEWKEELLPLIYSAAPYWLSTSDRAEKEMQAEETYKEIIKISRETLQAGDARTAYGYIRKAMELPGHERDEDALGIIFKCASQGRRSGLRNAWCRHTL